jgi:nicotinamide riboside kinase
MVIGFTGTHCTGKSTLVRQLTKIGYREVSNSIRDYIAKFPQYQEQFFKGDEALQFHFLHQHINRTCAPHYPSASDRTSIDYLAYYMRLPEQKFPEMYKELAMSALINYDVIFYTPIEFEFIDDNLRFKDDSRVQVDENICSIIREIKKDDTYVDIIPVTGSIQERMNTIADTLREMRMVIH